MISSYLNSAQAVITSTNLFLVSNSEPPYGKQELEGISDIKDMACLVFEPTDSHLEFLCWAWCELYDKMVPRSKMIQGSFEKKKTS